MLNPKNVLDDSNVVNIDFKLDARQRGILNATVKQEGFDIIQHLFIDEIRQFNTALMNTPVSDREAVVLNHLAAKVAAQLYQGFFERVRTELELHESEMVNLGSVDNPMPSPVTPDFL